MLTVCYKNAYRESTSLLNAIHSLQNRGKNSNSNIKVRDAVIIKEDNAPPDVDLGKVLSTHPGKDGMVRVVTLKTLKWFFKRPTVKTLCIT
ncbi:hypothetical protein NPIL_227291 [Nephila pilipes]|uniref:DUF5641 domain-containing protein n=1 Tax=Nephila pilipes TaxID=299642 RepID=A0A8X6T6P8_NEPPI|nr:hypothetical protein NPIL_227291 [Nephila pilipes]